MSQTSKVILGVIAASLTLGAVQLASGHDLGIKPGIQQAVSAQQPLTQVPATVTNRSAKADRIAGSAGAGAQTRTISFKLDRLTDTSILVRVPVVKPDNTEARNVPAAPSLFQNGERRKATVACEPMVSMLTEVAKRLQPGRCVT